MQDFKYIANHITDADALCQVAEEAAELAQAALKLRRVLDGGNPSPVPCEAAVTALCEEIADVNVSVTACLVKLGIPYSVISNFEEQKIERWVQRLQDKASERN